MLTPEGNYYNFSGCGNTLNCNHPIVRQMILECLRYWTINYRVDGFRFDLASILGRNEDGSPMNKPPLLESLAHDPILGNVKLIAEACIPIMKSTMNKMAGTIQTALTTIEAGTVGLRGIQTILRCWSFVFG